MKIERTSYLFYILAAILLLPPALRAGEDLPTATQAILATKIIAQDSAITEKAKGSVNIGIIASDAATAKEIASEFSALADKKITIAGLAIKTQILPAGWKAELADVQVVFMAVEIAEAVKIIAATQEKKILSIAGKNAEEEVRKGVCVGVQMDDNKPQILLNPASAGKEGRNFSPQLLQLVKLVK